MIFLAKIKPKWAKVYGFKMILIFFLNAREDIQNFAHYAYAEHVGSVTMLMLSIRIVSLCKCSAYV